MSQTLENRVSPKVVYYVALKAIDGSLRQDPDNCSCCAASEARYLQLDFQKKHLVHIIQALGRQDGTLKTFFTFTTNIIQQYNTYSDKTVFVCLKFITYQSADEYN